MVKAPDGGMAGPGGVAAVYQNAADAWADARPQGLAEAPLLARLAALAPGRAALDLGCGAGLPLGRWLADRGFDLTGLDAAPAMIALFRRNLPEAQGVVADMRALDLSRRYDALLAWDSLFHLAPGDQRALYPRLAAHAAPGAGLLFTTGPAAGTRIGRVAGRAVYHASLSPGETRRRLAAAGFELLDFVPEDPAQGGRSWVLARRW